MINDQKVKLGPINTICQNRNRPLILGIGSPQFSGWRTENFVIKINKSDCCVKTNNGSILLIENIATCEISKRIMVIGRCYEQQKPFFLQPCNSTLFGIYRVSKLGALRAFYIDDIKEKLIRLPLNENIGLMIIIPFIHNDN